MKKEQKNLVRTELKNVIYNEVNDKIKKINDLVATNKANIKILNDRKRQYSQAIDNIINTHLAEEDISNLIDEWSEYKNENDRFDVMYSSISNYLNHRYDDIARYICDKIILFLLSHKELITNKRDLTDFLNILNEDHNFINARYDSFYSSGFEISIETPNNYATFHSWLLYSEINKLLPVQIQSYKNSYVITKDKIEKEIPTYDQLFAASIKMLNNALNRRDELKELENKYNEDTDRVVKKYKQEDVYGMLSSMENLSEDLK